MINISPQVRNTIKSTATTVFISALCGTSAYLFGSSFWAAFALATAIQYIAGYIIATYVFSSYKNSVYMAELDKLEKLSTILNCAYCDHQNVFTFLPDEVPDLKCEQCQNVNSVKLHFTVARTASTISTNIADILKEPQTNNKINL